MRADPVFLNRLKHAGGQVAHFDGRSCVYGVQGVLMVVHADIRAASKYFTLTIVLTLVSRELFSDSVDVCAVAKKVNNNKKIIAIR